MAPLIFKLPDELLLNIADRLNMHSLFHYYPVKEDTPIMNFSMTCRRFRGASLHLLVRSITVDFRHSSLARLEEITSHPGIGKGVRSIKVCLRVFSQELSEDFTRYVEFYTDELENHFSLNRNNYEEPQEIVRVINSWTQVALKHEKSDEETLTWSSEEDLVHFNLLKKAHDRHKSMYAQQQSLFKSGEFFRRVAAAMARMPLARCLTISNTTLLRSHTKYWDIPARPGVDMWDAYYQPMLVGVLSRQAWEIAQTTLFPTIVRLPIALHSAGVPIDAFDIYLDGLEQDDLFQCDNHTLLALNAAVQTVRSIIFNGTPYFDIINEPPLEHLHSILAHLVNNPNLESLALDMYVPDDHDDDFSVTWNGSCLTLTPELPRKHLTSVTLFGVRFRSCELLAFLSSLPRHMKEMHLDEVRLLDGTWDEVLDVMRKKTYRYDYAMKLVLCSGGEETHMTEKQRITFFRQDKKKSMEPSYLEEYILRYKKKNPLRAFRQGEWDEKKYWEDWDDDETE